MWKSWYKQRRSFPRLKWANNVKDHLKVTFCFDLANSSCSKESGPPTWHMNTSSILRIFRILKSWWVNLFQNLCIWWFNLFCVQRPTSMCTARTESEGTHCLLTIAIRKLTSRRQRQRACSRAPCPWVQPFSCHLCFCLSKLNQKWADCSPKAYMISLNLLQKHCGEGNSTRYSPPRVLIPSAFLSRWWIWPVNLSDSWIINSCEVWVIFYFGFNRKVIGVWNWTRPRKPNTGIPHRGTICRLDLQLFESQMHFSWYKVSIEQWVCIVNGDWCEHRFWRFSHMLYILEILKIWFSHNMSHMLIFWRDRNDNI